ncbi:hypothetical protein PR003_g16787 [Phytophthora rubi]|uniref:Uncharacterized protein n=1 Tax=Phytophthora rubi TaxID=129364 RepID=A0A6A4ETR6_9STRA|nr:hypothetical protein PR003_g16787 [Phytophthora rubi]
MESVSLSLLLPPPLGTCAPVARRPALQGVALATRRGAVGKLIFTLEKNGTAHIKSVGLARVDILPR